MRGLYAPVARLSAFSWPPSSCCGAHNARAADISGEEVLSSAFADCFFADNKPAFPLTHNRTDPLSHK
jgi:hypothetical protein